MQITLCKHVPLRKDEIASLPAAWHSEAGVSLAGGPVEALDAVGLPKRIGLSIEPCANPGKEMLGHGDPDRWLPIGCKKCPSCLAREKLHQRALAAAG